MALSGSFTTTAYSNRSLTFSWSATQSVSGNYSDISWSLKGSGSQSQYFKAAPFKVVIDGEQVYYSENRIQLLNGTLVASGTKRINHNTDGSRSFSASVVAAIYSYANNVSGSGSWSLDSIPRAATITGANSITDEGNPYFTFSNAAGYTDLVAELEINPVNTHLFSRSISNTGSYTFELTDEERATLRSYLANTNSATLRYLLYSNSKNFVSYVDKTINVVNATPTFTSSVKDTERASTVLTGSTAGNVSMIKGFNYMACSMEATAYKGASITKYKITNGANAVEAAAADFNNTESNTFKFEVWDSRGNYNSYTTTIPMIDYIPLTCNVDGKIVLSTSDSTKATVSFTAQGNCFKGSFGAVDNTLALDYTVADTEGNVVANDVVDIALNSNTYSIDIDVEDLDYRKSYVVYVKATDAIKSMQANSKTLKAIPIFDWGEEDFNFNVPVKIRGINVENKFEESNWKDCTLTAVKNKIYDNSYTAKYRYNDTYIEICCTGTYFLNAESIEAGETMIQISGLEVPIPTEAFSEVWDDSAKSFVPVKLTTDGKILTGGSGVSIAINHWLSLSHIYFRAFYG